MKETDATGLLTPARIAGIYLAFGLVALAVSDLLLPRLLDDPLLRQAQAGKGAVEVALTAALVYGLAWYGQRSLRSANRRLERNDQVLQVLLRLLRHNIRNEMNVIQGHAEEARSNAEGDDVVDSCDAILSTADELLGHTETVNELRSVLEGSTEVRTFDLSAVVEEAVWDARRDDDTDFKAATDGVERVTAVANSLLPAAVAEVLDNAIRYSECPQPRVEFETVVSDEVVDLRITDEGPGIPEAERQVLDAREESPLSHSSGLGLWFVHWVVTDSGGSVSVDTLDGGGTQVTLSLPRATGG